MPEETLIPTPIPISTNVKEQSKTHSQWSIDPETATFAEKIVVIGILGALALFCLYKGNFEGGSGYATSIIVYAGSRKGV